MKLNNKAQALVEYVLIITLVSMLIIGLVKFFGGYIKDSMTKTTCSISGLEYEKGDKPGSGKCVEVEDVEDVFKKES